MSLNTQPHLQAAAEALRQARQSRQAIAPITQSHQVSGLDEAYAVAQINTEYKVSQGARIIGKKVGLT